MNEFPFTAAEWQEVSEATRALVNATLMDDKILQAAKFAELQIVLARLRDRYGEHPVLLETEADFTNRPIERVRLYEQAKELALKHQLPTYSIRLWLADVLLHDLAQPNLAKNKLLQCQEEVGVLGDEFDKRKWSELNEKCKRLG